MLEQGRQGQYANLALAEYINLAMAGEVDALANQHRSTAHSPLGSADTGTGSHETSNCDPVTPEGTDQAAKRLPRLGQDDAVAD